MIFQAAPSLFILENHHKMKVTTTNIKGLLVLEPKVFGDHRGYFFESYNKETLKGHVDVDFVQDNESFSSYGVLRGLHYQLPPYAQSKLVRVVQGEVLDVAVDIREGSNTYGQWFSVRLSAENKKQFFIPRGFAHGFVVLSDTAIFAYKCDNYYNKESEGGLMYNDSKLNIDWEIPMEDMKLSEKDLVHPKFGEHQKFFEEFGK